MWRRKSLSHVQLFCDPIGCSPPGSSVHGILRGKNTGVGCHFLLQGIFPTTDWIGVSHIAGRFFTIWATGKPRSYVSQLKSLRAEKIKKFKKSHRPQWRLRPQVLQWRPWAARLFLKIGKKKADTGGALKTEYKLFSHSVVSDSLWPHGLQHTRPPCPSPPPRTCSNSCPSSRWCHQQSHPLSPPSPAALSLSQKQSRSCSVVKTEVALL